MFCGLGFGYRFCCGDGLLHNWMGNWMIGWVAGTILREREGIGRWGRIG